MKLTRFFTSLQKAPGRQLCTLHAQLQKLAIAHTEEASATHGARKQHDILPTLVQFEFWRIGNLLLRQRIRKHVCVQNSHRQNCEGCARETYFKQRLWYDHTSPNSRCAHRNQRAILSQKTCQLSFHSSVRRKRQAINASPTLPADGPRLVSSKSTKSPTPKKVS